MEKKRKSWKKCAFLEAEFSLQVEVMCNGEIMGKDHTLEFVYMTRWRVKVRDYACVF